MQATILALLCASLIPHAQSLPEEPAIHTLRLHKPNLDCQSISKSDALLIIDVQNDFMEAAPIPSDKKPLNEIPPNKICDGKICGGSLGVTGSSEIIAPINQWIAEFTSKGGQVFASLDWHPQGHCSFCRNGTASSNPKYFHPGGALCGPGGKDSPGFDYTGRCQDLEAKAAFEDDTLMQWPDHCRHTGGDVFGSRFHPYLDVNDKFTVVKKGFHPTLDSYSAFGGTESVQGFPYDTEDNEKVLSSRKELRALMEAGKVERLFVVGIAIDYCVLHSTLDAIGKDPFSGKPAVKGLKEVVLVEGAARGVTPATVAAALKEMQKAGAVVSNTTSPSETLKAICHPEHLDLR